ncbi:MAG: DUF4058 family protein [Planctomyces sp.]|jgi:hypothetical protein
MPVHDWSRVAAGIFHDFHHAWIEEIKRSLNAGLLPSEYYALAEQRTAGYGPDVLALQVDSGDDEIADPPARREGSLIMAKPRVAVTSETDMEFYRRKQNVVAVHHVSDDRVVAMVEVVSPGNKSSRGALRSFVEKTAQLLDQRIHLLILDLHQPGKFDPQGIHGAIWEEIAQPWTAPTDQPLTLVGYESALTVRAFVQPTAVGDVLIDMPLYLEPDGYVLVPLETTYNRAFDALPGRWRKVIEAE